MTGPPGSGKTRLGVEFARVAAGRFADGVVFVELAAVSRAELFLPALAGALGLEQRPGSTLLSTISETIRDREILLLLDNMEQVLTAGPELVDLLKLCPALKALVSSRVCLGVTGESEFPIPCLDFPEPHRPMPLHLLEQQSAIALFLDRARDAKPLFSLTPQNAAQSPPSAGSSMACRSPSSSLRPTSSCTRRNRS